ncbi:hypothetical protein Vretifemale_14487 [Volvox reticuliferus]|uniref:Uncharacterized protein n=1 Tax=Volvox reticuliferus TaxID=1737510 RepID=A0A8J4FRJ4_9CHLO|nr:hypothetical protein Vretifemale_14487 [Volvox reticuliferus]
MISSNQEAPAFRSSAIARELERIRAKRRLLETVAKVAPTSAGTAITPLQQTASATKGDVDPVNRNAKIKANARKLLDQLQAADTSLGDTAHNLKLLFAKQALRALTDRQAVVVAEAQQRKLDKLQERLVEEHRRQQQQNHAYVVQMQLQGQQQAPSQAQLLAQTPPVPTPSPASAKQLSPKRLERGKSPPSWHRSRSRRDRRRSSSRRSPSPPTLEKQKRSDEDYGSFLNGYSYESDAQRSDAVHVRDSWGSSPRGRDRNAHGSRSRGAHYREPRLAGPTEAGARGAVSAQALSALLAGLQSHGVNLTSGPPPPPPPQQQVTTEQTNLMNNGEVAREAAGAALHSGGSAAKGSDSAAAEQQYVLLPDGTVGLVHTIVKPAVLQPKITAGGQMPPTPPHAVPLVLLQPGGPGAAGGGAAATTIAPWHTSYPYTTLGPPPPPPPAAPYYPSSPLGLYGTQTQYSYPPSLYGVHSPISPSPYSIQTSASTGPAAMTPSLSPPPLYMSLYPGADGAYYRHHPRHQQQNQDSQIPSSTVAGTAAHAQDPQSHHPYAPYRTDSSLAGHQRSGVGQLTTAASHLGRDVDTLGGNVRHSVSSLSSDPYGNLAGSVLIGNPTEDGAGGGGGGGGRIGGIGVSGVSRASPQPPQQQAAAVASPSSPHQQTSSSGMPSSGTDTPPGNVPGGSGVYSGGRYHHRHSHSGAESLRSLPSNSGGSTRGGPGSVSISQQYEATLASPSLRGSLQDLDSPASLRDMPRRASGSISLSPLRGGARGGGVHGSLDSGPHFVSGTGDGGGDYGGGSGSGATRRRPSPLLVASVATDRGSDANMPPAVPLGSSGSSSGGSIVLRVTAAGSVPAQLPQGGTEPSSGMGSGAGTGGGDEPSLLLRTLDLGSASMQRSKLSDDQAETPTSRKPSLTSPWSSSGPSDAIISASGGLNLGGYGGHSGGGSPAAAAATFPSTRDLLSDVASRPPLYGTSLPYGTAGLYDRYAAGGFYGATGGMYSPSPLYGASPTIGSSFGGFDVSGGSGSLLDRGASGGSGGGGLGTGAIIGAGGSPSAAPRSPSTDSLRSAGTGVRAYAGAVSPAAAAQGGQTALSTATSDLMGTSAALALTAAILEGSPASAAANSIIAGSTVGLSAAAVYGLGQLGLNHLHPTAAVLSSMPSATGVIPSAANPGNAPPPSAVAGLDRPLSMNRVAQVSENGSGAGGPGTRGGIGSGPQGISVANAASAAVAARLSHGSNLDNMFSPRARSRVQLMGNDDFTDAFFPSSSNFSGANPQSLVTNGQLLPPQVASTGSMRLTAATLNAQQQQLQQQLQQLQQQGPTSPAQPSPSRLGSVRSPASGASGGSGSAAAVNIPAGATDIGGLQSMVPTLQLPPRATSRMLAGPVSVAAAVAAAPQLQHGGGAGSGTSGPSSETASPTRMEHLSDLRDIDAEQSLSGRSGRSALSEVAAGGGTTTAASGSSVERISGVPVVEHHRDGGSDPAAYAGLIGGQPFDTMADVGVGVGGSGFGGAYGSSTVYVTGGTAPVAVQQPQQGLPPLLELLSNSPFAATASPSGSAGLSPLGFGGGSTPLERSADSFVRIGSMPFSGAASPMATNNPIELLGSPTKHPQGQISAVMTRGSSGGASSAGGGASIGGGGSSRSAVSATISAALPQVQPPAPGPLQNTATSMANPQLQATPAGLTVPGPQSQPHQAQQHLGGMSFRMSSTGGTGAVSPQALGTAVISTVVAPASPAVAAAAVSGPAGPVSPSGNAVGRTTSMHSMPTTAKPLPAAGASGKVLSPSASRSARSSAASPAAMPASPSQRGVAASVGGSGGRTGATAILNRVLAGRGEFDSDDDDDSGVGTDGMSSFSMSLRRDPSSGLQRPSSLVPAAGTPTGPRVSAGTVLSPGRGTLTAANNAHDDEFNF